MAAMVADEIPVEAEPLAVEQDADARLAEQGTVYAATADEAVEDAAVITGTLPIHSISAIVLFDSGSTHTFLAQAFVDRVGLEVVDLGFDSQVSTPVGVILTTRVGVRDVTVEIQ